MQFDSQHIVSSYKIRRLHLIRAFIDGVPNRACAVVVEGLVGIDSNPMNLHAIEIKDRSIIDDVT